MLPGDFAITNLGSGRFDSPLNRSTVPGDGVGDYVRDDARVLHDVEFLAGEEVDPQLSLERAGARETIFFDPAQSKAAIVTCGGLCPGLNNIIRSIFFKLHSNYKVPEVWGIRYGYQGLNPQSGFPPIKLNGEFVQEIHKIGGTVLGSSRGPQDPARMVDWLDQAAINMLFCVGGDGTQRGAHAIAQEIRKRGIPISVVGIPKTIDNDIKYVWQTFGYATALEKAREVIACAHNEAKGAPNGIGLVKLMGREAGFIAAGASLASGQVNFTLIPEIPIPWDGPDGLLAKLERRIKIRHHAVIVVAEGAGQDLLSDAAQDVDASGNQRLGDIGVFLKNEIGQHFSRLGWPVSIKYFDPSYHIRSVPANCTDSMLCDQMAEYAVHAAMAGKTDLLIGLWHNQFVHVPLALTTRITKRLSSESDLWMAVLAATGQNRY